MSKPIVVVTGSGSGIGQELSNQLKQYYDVIGVNRKCNHSINDLICDVGNEKEVVSLVKVVDSLIGDRGIKLLINCAAINRIEYLENLTVDDWDESYSSNVRSVFLMSKYFLPYLSREKGTICNIGSVAGRQPMRATLPYCSSKAALTMMTKQMARELFSRYNISVFEFSIGARVIGTEMTEYVRKQVCKVRGWKEEEYDFKDDGLKVEVSDIVNLMMNFLRDCNRLWMLNGNIVEIGG